MKMLSLEDARLALKAEDLALQITAELRIHLSGNHRATADKASALLYDLSEMLRTVED